jgi:hypothetical protein
MALEGTLSVEGRKNLADDLSSLAKGQSDALQSAVYMPMSEEQAKDYDQRGMRIGTISKLLGTARLPASRTGSTILPMVRD